MDVVRITNGLLNVDYVSISYDDGVKDDQQANLRDVARLRQMYPAFSEKDYRKIARYGYKGMAIGSSFVGRNVALRCLEVHSGSAAKDFVLPETVRFASVIVNRIDFSIDLTLSMELLKSRAISIANETIEDVVKVISGFGKNKQRKITRVSNSDGGLTYYIGSRLSDRMLRIYNKTAESEVVAADGVYPSIVRLEVELKDKEAQPLVWYLQSNSRDDLVRAAASHFMSFGLQVLSIEVAERIPWIDSSWIDRRIMWLQRQVAPAIRDILYAVDKSEILRVLGLDSVDD